MKISRQVGTVSEVLSIFIQDSTVSTGAGLANVSSTSVNFAWMRNNQAVISSGACTAGGTLGTYSVSTLTQMNSTSTLGWYHFCPPDAVFASGGSAILHLYGYPNMAPVPIEIELTKTNNQQYMSSVIFSSTNIVSSISGPVGVSSISTPITVSSGVVQVSSITIPVGVSSFALGVGVSSFALPVGVSSFAIGVGVSSSIMVSSNIVQVNGITVDGVGSDADPWGPV